MSNARLANITVNGLPVAQYIENEQRKEILAVHREETAKVRLPKKITYPVRNHSNARHRNKLVYKNNQVEQKVMFRGEVFPWLEKAPFVASGKSILGGVELNKDESAAKCHECGTWVAGLSNHVRRAHGIRVRDYRIRHGIGIDSPIEGREVRKRRQVANIKNTPKRRHPPTAEEIKRMQAAKQASTGEHMRRRVLATQGRRAYAELANLRGNCEAQTLKALRDYADSLGRIPTITELQSYSDNHGRHILQASRLRRFFGVPMAMILKRAGLSRGRQKVRK